MSQYQEKQQINQTKWYVMRVIMFKIMKMFLCVISIYFNVMFLYEGILNRRTDRMCQVWSSVTAPFPQIIDHVVFLHFLKYVFFFFCLTPNDFLEESLRNLLKESTLKKSLFLRVQSKTLCKCFVLQRVPNQR